MQHGTKNRRKKIKKNKNGMSNAKLQVKVEKPVVRDKDSRRRRAR